MDRRRQEALEWFVEFANIELGNLKPGDKAKFLVEARQHLWPIRELQEFVLGFTYGDSGSESPLDRKAVLDQQFKNFLRKIVYKDGAWSLEEPPREDTEEFWSMTRALQEATRQILSTFCAFSGKEARHGQKRSSSSETESFFNVPYLVNPSWGEDGIFRLDQFPIARDHQEYVLLKIYRLMDGLWAFALRKCPGCDKFFLNFSLRRKTYCSPRCMWRARAKRYRTANPDKYREYQNEFMRRKYEKATKARSGSNVKISRRPRKKSG